jgi:hypothetical protein
MLHQATKKLSAENPKILFFVDCVGALLSVVLLAIVLVKLQHLFGIPRSSLYFLAMFPCLFAVYDLNCIVRDRLNVVPFLKAIAIMNCCYCALSLAVAIYQYKDLTVLGWIYILGEITIVSILANVEFNVAKALANLKR